MMAPSITRCAIVIVALNLPSIPTAAHAEWSEVCPGVEYTQFAACTQSPHGDSKITIVRVAPERVQLRVLSAAELGLRPLRAVEWADQFDLAVVINAGMFDTDWRTNLGYMKIRDGHLNNATVRKDYKSIFVFNPRDPARHKAAILDLEDVSIKDLSSKYGGIVQNLRMIRAPGKVVWSPSTRKWSEAALGMDRSGRLLFIFCDSPYSMFEFSHCLLKLPLDLVAAQHLEGGGAAALVIRTPRLNKRLVGSRETARDGRELEQGTEGSPLPNVLAITACH